MNKENEYIELRSEPKAPAKLELEPLPASVASQLPPTGARGLRPPRKSALSRLATLAGFIAVAVTLGLLAGLALRSFL